MVTTGTRLRGRRIFVRGPAPRCSGTCTPTNGGRWRSSLAILIRMKLAEALALRADAARRAEQLLARRDVLRLRHGVITSAASAAAGEGQRGFRQLRSELKMIPALLVAELRGQADDLARQLREVDT